MKAIRKLLIMIIVLIIDISLNNVYAEVQGNNEGVKINAAVFLYNFQDQYISLVKQSLEDIQKENENYNLFIINFVITKVV